MWVTVEHASWVGIDTIKNTSKNNEIFVFITFFYNAQKKYAQKCLKNQPFQPFGPSFFFQNLVFSNSAPFFVQILHLPLFYLKFICLLHLPTFFGALSVLQPPSFSNLDTLPPLFTNPASAAVLSYIYLSVTLTNKKLFFKQTMNV